MDAFRPETQHPQSSHPWCPRHHTRHIMGHNGDNMRIHHRRQITCGASYRPRRLRCRADARVQGQHTRSCGRTAVLAERHSACGRLDRGTFHHSQRHSDRRDPDHREGPELGQYHRHPTPLLPHIRGHAELARHDRVRPPADSPHHKVRTVFHKKRRRQMDRHYDCHVPHIETICGQHAQAGG